MTPREESPWPHTWRELWELTNRPRPEAPACFEQPVGHCGDDEEHGVDKDVLLEEDPAPSVLLQSRPYQQAIDGLIATCKAENLRTSALEWYRAHPAELGGMGVSVWLQCVLEDLGPRKKRELGIVVVAEEMSDPIFSGNVVVSDVLVEPA